MVSAQRRRSAKLQRRTGDFLRDKPCRNVALYGNS